MKFSIRPATVLRGAFVLLAATTTAFPAVIIAGRVLDKDTGEPLSAYVLAEVNGRGVSADGQGRFRITIDLTPEPTEVRLTVWLIGYKKASFTIRPGTEAALTLERDVMDAREVSVTADSGVAEQKNKQTVSLSKMEVYSTPGTAADPLNASQILPGVNALPDSSGLLIRGGAPDEVGYYFDGLEIPHPFLSESLHESYFSIFDNQVIDRFNVSTSGFAPKYNDALSGLMDLTVKDSVSTAQGGLGLSVLGLNGQLGLPIRGVGSLIASVNRTDSRLLSLINHRRAGEFTNGQAFGKLLWNVHPAHQLRFYGLYNGYDYAQSGTLDVFSRNEIGGLSWTYAPGSHWVLKTLATNSFYTSTIRIPNALQIRTRDRVHQVRLDAAWDSGRHLLEFGLNGQDRRREIAWTEPTAQSYDVQGRRFSFYAQDQFRLSDRLFLTAGANVLALSLLGGRPSFSPRVSGAYFLTPKDILRVSAGVYRQAGDDFTMQRYPDLSPKSAVLFGLSYDRISERSEFRATVYDKEYTRLYLMEKDGSVSSGGAGFARGAELFGKITSAWFDILAVYNFLSSKRRENDTPILANSPYAIAHSATLVGTWKFSGGSVGLRYSFAAGRPYTPLLGRVEDPDGGGFQPIWGDPFSENYPAYRRLDFNGTVQFKLARRLIVVYYGLTNVLDAGNVLRYDYTDDYAGRIDQPSIFGRTLFFGLYVPFF